MEMHFLRVIDKDGQVWEQYLFSDHEDAMRFGGIRISGWRDKNGDLVNGWSFTVVPIRSLDDLAIMSSNLPITIEPQT